MEDQGTDVCFALFIFVYADSAKCVCLELSKFGAVRVFYSVHLHMQAVNAGHRCSSHLISQASGRKEVILPNSLSSSVC